MIERTLVEGVPDRMIHIVETVVIVDRTIEDPVRIFRKHNFSFNNCNSERNRYLCFSIYKCND